MRFKKSMLEIASVLDETIAKGEELTRTADMTLSEMHFKHKQLVKSLNTVGGAQRLKVCSDLARLSRQILKSKHERGLIKSISFNPLEPHDMNVESTYYSPYRLLSDGSYAPHDKGYWMQQAPQLHADGEFGGQQMRILSADEERMRDDGYSEVSKFYRAAGVFKSELYSEIDKLVKALPSGNPPPPPGGSGKPRGLPVGTIHDWQGVRYQKQGDGQWLPVQQGKGPHPVEQDAQAKQKQLQQIIKDRTEGRAKEPGLDDRARKATEKANEVGAKEADLEHRDRQAKDRDLSHREQKIKDKEVELEHHSKLLEKHSKKAPLEAQFCGTECQSDLKKKTSRRGKGQGEHVDLTKQELAHTLQHGRFAIISAGKNPNDPEDSKLKDGDIKKRHGGLEKELKDAGYTYTKVKGHYGGQEDSFLVMVHEADRGHMRSLGKELKQDSVIYSDAGKQEMIYTNGKDAGQRHTGTGFEEKPDAEDYFTEFKHPDGSKTKFSLKFDFNKKDQADPKANAPGDHGRPQNHLTDEAFTKPGADLDRKDVDHFISKFEPDFKRLTYMGEELKQAGATHFASRLKDGGSLLQKMQSRLGDRSLNTVTDVIGARALTSDLHSQQSMLKAVHENYNVVELDDSSSKPRKDGYRAIHVLFRTPNGMIGELQLKTHLQQIFSGFSHDSIYKGHPEIKGNPEVLKYTNQLSDYLHGLDKGEKDDPKKRPVEPPIMQKHEIRFPWSDVEGLDSLDKEELIKKADAKVKYYLVVRDENKKTKDVHEFDSFNEAKAKRDEVKKTNPDYELPIGYAHSKEEFLHTFSEYGKGPGSRGGQVVGKTKTGKVKYQRKNK